MKFLCSQTAVLILAALSCTELVQSQSGGPGFVLSVRIHRYTNPTHRLGMTPDNRCCDSEETSDCDDPCDNAFFFCLRPYGSPQQANGRPLAMESYTVEAFCISSDTEARDCDNLLFSSTFGSAPNPLTFSGDSWPGGFQLLTEVVDQDRDPNPDDFVDRIITELLLSPDSGSTIQMESPGEFNFGFLRMSFDVVCNEDFGGPNCTAYCGVEGCSPERATCGEPGVCVCLDGYGGDDCTIESSGSNTPPPGTSGSNTPPPGSIGSNTPPPGSSGSNTNPPGSSRGSNTGAIVGGVIGGLVLLVLLVLVVAVIVLIAVLWRRQNEDHAYLKPEPVTVGGFEPGDNPNYTAAMGTHIAESAFYHKLENPLYTAVDNHEYAIPDTHPPSIGSSGQYSTVSNGAPPSRPSHHYEYIKHSNSSDSATAVADSSSRLPDSSNRYEFSNTLYQQLLH